MTNPEPLTPGPMQDGIPRCRHGRRDYIEVTSEAITRIEAESRNATLDEVLRAVEGLPTIFFTAEQDPSAGDVVYRAAVIEAVKALRG